MKGRVLIRNAMCDRIDVLPIQLNVFDEDVGNTFVDRTLISTGYLQAVYVLVDDGLEVLRLSRYLRIQYDGIVGQQQEGSTIDP